MQLPKHFSFILLVGFTLLVSVGAHSSYAQEEEYRVKAVFLSKFPGFVSWPAQTFNTPGDPIVIGVYGADPFGASLSMALKGEEVRGRSLNSKAVTTLDEVKTCQILFIPSTQERDEVQALLEEFADKPVLTVVDSPEQMELGAVMGFTMENGRVKLLINPKAASTAKLQIQAKLLRLAKIVE